MHQTFVRTTTELLHLTINGAVVSTTAEHPFMVEGRGWLDAAFLKVGDRLVTPDGTTVPVEAIETEQRAEADAETVYNFHVETQHNYYVHAGERWVLVHNSDHVPVYRVESPGNARLNVGPGGEVSILGEGSIFLNFGDKVRAEDFLAKRLDQGFSETVLKEFEVAKSYFDDLASRAVPESMAKGNPVFKVDVTKTDLSYGLRSSEFPDLLGSIVPGSGR